MTRRKFSREFKIEAVRLVTDRGVAVAQAARDLDVAESVLRRWMRELTATEKEDGAGLGMQVLAVIAAELRCKTVVTSTAEGLRISLTFQSRAEEALQRLTEGT
jgi:transposase